MSRRGRKAVVAREPGCPLLNEVTFPLLICASIGAAKAATEGAYYAIQRGSTSTGDFQCTLKRMGEDAVYWGTVAGVYATTEYGLECMRGKHTWTNSFVAGAVTGAVICAMRKSKKDMTLMEHIVNGSIVCAACLAQNYIRGM